MNIPLLYDFHPNFKNLNAAPKSYAANASIERSRPLNSPYEVGTAFGHNANLFDKQIAEEQLAALIYNRKRQEKSVEMKLSSAPGDFWAKGKTQ